jgi:hypothetical protein
MLRLKKGNCFIWAILSFLKYGGKLKISKSDFGPIPRMHWLNPNDYKWYHYQPKYPLHYNALPRLRKIFMIHVLWFEGHVKQSRQ